MATDNGSAGLLALGVAVVTWVVISRSRDGDDEPPPPPPVVGGQFKIDDLGDGASLEIRGID